MKIATILFAKAPVSKYVKTRLAEYFGHDFALELYKLMLSWQWDNIQLLVETYKDINVFVYIAKPKEISYKKSLSYFSYLPKIKNITFCEQIDGDLGFKINHSFLDIKKNHDYGIIWGVDIPVLTIHDFISVIQCIPSASIIPAHDGGYCLMGIPLDQYNAKLVDNIPWSSNTVYKKQKLNFDKLNIPLHTFDKKPDLDTPTDVLKNILYMNDHLNDIYKKRLESINILLMSFTNRQNQKI